jgi:lycopene beta-cyclase
MKADLDYDCVIVGGGVSGMTLANRLSEEARETSRILVVDKDDDPDYNISFWLDRQPPFGPIMQKSWSRIEVRHGERRTVCPLSAYRLYAFWRDDFDAYLQADLAARPDVQLMDAAVTRIVDEGDSALVHTSTDTIRASWAFDSRSSVRSIREGDPTLLLMQGLAVEVETKRPIFDPNTATLFDFVLTTPTFDFMYVLPYSETYALVNVAFVTPHETSVTKQACRDTIDTYLRERLGCDDYEIVKHCYGRLPLATNYPTRRPESRIVPIGVRAGMMKACTSYAFTRILNDAQRLSEALRDTGVPFYEEDRSWFYERSDKSTARVFQREPELAQEVMFAMFSPDKGDMALRFLDEQLSLRDHGELFRHVPLGTLGRFLGQVMLGSVRN